MGHSGKRFDDQNLRNMKWHGFVKELCVFLKHCRDPMPLFVLFLLPRLESLRAVEIAQSIMKFSSGHKNNILFT